MKAHTLLFCLFMVFVIRKCGQGEGRRRWPWLLLQKHANRKGQMYKHVHPGEKRGGGGGGGGGGAWGLSLTLYCIQSLNN